jgi:outer membrane protein assembly factor BamB
VIGKRFALFLLALGLAAAAAAVAYRELRPHAPDVLGSTTREYRPATTATPNPAAGKAFAWPTYGYDDARTRSVDVAGLRPPFRRVWTFHGHALLEFPPVVSNGRVFETSIDGILYALDAKSGRILWKYRSGRCGWASPAIEDGLLVETFIGNPECRSTYSDGQVAAFDPRTGRRIWLRTIGPTESSPLVEDGTVYVGDWDGRIWALALRTGRTRWVRRLDGAVKGSVAGSGARLFIGTYGGEVAALSARSGAVAWISGGHGRFYSSPAVAYGRVYIGSTDGGVYAFGAGTGDLLWSHPTGGYVYASPAVWRRLVLVGSYDHGFYALDAGTGETRWSFPADGPISGSASVVDGIVYFATFSHTTYGLAAKSGRQVVRWPDGEYSPAVAGAGFLYWVGLGRLYALRPRA